MVLISRHSPVLGSLPFPSILLICVGDCSKVKDDSSILDDDLASVTVGFSCVTDCNGGFACVSLRGTVNH